MPKPPPLGPQPPEPLPPDETIETGFYEAPPEGQEPRKRPGLKTLISEAVGEDTDPQWSESTRLAPEPPGGEARPRRRTPWVKGVAMVLVAAAAGAAALAYRAHHRKEVLAQGLARARQLLYLDTHAGFRDAAQVLRPLADIDPNQAGSLRAFALAMLWADYRDENARAEAEALLVEPERAPKAPPAVNLARAALALGAREAGTASAFAARPGGGVFGATLQGRLALLVGNNAGALEPLDQALSAEPEFPAALALRGDALRRLRRFEAARAAYAGALRASPTHARAALGMAKLALGGRARPDGAVPALERLLADRSGTPSNERGRAALHLAALRRRLGDRAGAMAALDASGFAGRDRAWLEKAVTEEELARGGYRAVAGAPPGLQSASDDDPWEPPPAPPPKKKEAKAKPAKKAPAKKSAKKAGAKTSSKKAPRDKKKASSRSTARKVPGTGTATPKPPP